MTDVILTLVNKPWHIILQSLRRHLAVFLKVSLCLENFLVGLKIVMDFVPNHSSNKHVWFEKSVAREDPYTDFYVWKDPKGFDEDGKPIPPNNWVR